jgi:large subunit ribosomal protein L10
MLTRTQKQEQLAMLKDRVARANSILAVDYRGMTVAQMTELRRKLRGAAGDQVEYRVAKNTLLKRAADGSPLAGIGGFLAGPTAVAFAFDEPAAVAKVLVDYAKDNEKLSIKGGVIEGDVLDASGIERLARTPSRQELRGMLAGAVQAPLQNLVGALNSLLGSLCHALEQRRTQLES